MLFKMPKIALGGIALMTLSSLASAGPIADGRYEITSRHSGLNLEVANGSQSDGANVIQWAGNGYDNQKFDLRDLGNGYYSIRPAHSGKSLDVYGWNSDPGAEIRQWSYTGASNQQWSIQNAGSGYFSIISRFNGLALDVWQWSSSSGGDIRQWTPTGGSNQQWAFHAVGGSTSKGASCNSTGNVTVSSTIVVNGGVYDGQCRTFNPTSALGDGGQAEGQKPVFRLENGAVLKNVIIGRNGADGIHIYGGATVDNVLWTDVGEDALTVKSQGNVTLRNIEAYQGYDKFLQINAPTNMTVSNCVVDNMGKFLRQNGGTGFTINVTVDNCDISNMKEAIFRTDSNTSTARLTNSRMRNTKTTCYGPWRSCSTSNVSGF